MGPVSMVSRAQRRRRRQGSIVLTLVIGLVGGLGMALVAGASRARSVVDRYFAPGVSYDVSTFGPPVPVDQVLAMPGVVAASRETYIGGLANRVADDEAPEVVNLQGLDGPPWDPMVRVLQGRLPAPDDITSMAVNQQVLDDFGLHLGDSLTMQLFTDSDYGILGEGGLQASGATVTLRVVAVIDSPDDLGVDVVTGASQAANHTEALVPFQFYAQHIAAGDMSDFGYGYNVDLDSPSSLAAFEQAFSAASAQQDPGATSLFGGSALSFSPAVFSTREAVLAAPARVQAAVLLVLGITTAIVGVVVLALILASDERLHSSQREILVAIGMTRTQRGLIALRRSLMAILAAAALAAVVAVGLSTRFPVGTVRPLERDPGLDINVAILLGGLTVLVVLGALVAVGVGHLALGRRTVASPRPSRTERWFARFDVSPPARVGRYLAFPGRGTARVVPAWQTIGVGAVAVACVVGVALYATSTEHLRSDGAAHGFGWDLVIGNSAVPMSHDVHARLVGDPRFSSAVDASYGGATIGGESAQVLAFAAGDPNGAPTIVGGRAPRTAGEIALGTHLLKRLGVSIDDTVQFSLAGSDIADPARPAKDLTLTIVGTTVIPGTPETDFADAATVTMDVLADAGAVNVTQLLLVHFRPGVDRATALIELVRQYPDWITTGTVPAKVESLWRGRVLPVAGAAVMALLGAVLLAYALGTTARLMRRELAVLRALGMRPRGVRNAVVWQGLLTSLVVLVIGIPAGLILGGMVWRVVADQLGVAGQFRLSPLMLLVAPTTALIAVLAAFGPARRAQNLRVVEALRIQ